VRRLLIFLISAAGALAPAAYVRVPPAAAQAPSGSVGIRLLEAPKARQNDPRARIYIVDHLAPGTTIRRHIEVSNGTGERLRISLYAAGADVADAGFRFADGRTQNELSRWINVSPSSVLVGARSAAQALVTIAVPPTASSGERYAVVWAEPPPSKPAGGSGVTTVNRVGIRVYLSVGPGGEPASDFRIVSLTASRDRSGAPVVTAQVRNTGGRALDLSGELRLAGGPGGLSAGPFDARLGTTLGVGETGSVVVPLDRAIPAGPWDATMMLRSGALEREASARITFPSGAGESAGAVKASSGRRPFVWLALGLPLLVLLGLFLLFKRRRADEEHREPPQEPAEPSRSRSRAR
jgi:hypothetical protein